MGARVRTSWLVAALACSVAWAAPQEAPEPGEHARLVLTDGTELEGELVAANDAVVTFRVDGVTRAYARTRVASLDAVAFPPDGTDASERDPPRELDEPRLPEASPALERWLATTIDALVSDDPRVARSAAAALAALGPAALDALERALETADETTRPRLERVAAALRRRAGTTGSPTEVPSRPATDDAALPSGESASPRELEADARVGALAAELGLDASHDDDVRDAVVTFRAGAVAAARAWRSGEFDERALRGAVERLRRGVAERLAPHLDEPGRLLLRERTRAWGRALLRRLRTRSD